MLCVALLLIVHVAMLKDFLQHFQSLDWGNLGVRGIKCHCGGAADGDEFIECSKAHSVDSANGREVAEIGRVCLFHASTNVAQWPPLPAPVAPIVLV